MIGKGRVGLVVVLYLLFGFVGPARAEQNTDQATLTQTYVRSADGTRLEANVYRPRSVAGGQRTPVVLYVSPYLNTGGSGFARPAPDGPAVTRNFPYDLEAAGLFERGYTFVQVALRGTAGSEGCNDLGGRGEQADVHAAVEWAASQPWSTGRVGLVGHSYDGWTGIMGLATDPEGLAAVVADAPVISPYRAIFENGNAYLPEGYFLEAVFQYNDLLPPAVASGEGRIATALVGSAARPDCYVTKSAHVRNPDPEAAFWRERDLLDRASASDVPVLMSFGFSDGLVRPSQFPALWSSLNGPKRAWFGQWGHNAASAPDPGSFWDPRLVGRAGFSTETLDFFDEYLAGRPSPRRSRVVVERSDGAWRGDSEWPPTGAIRASLPILPGSYRDIPGNSATGRAWANPLDGTRPAPSASSGQGSWTIGAAVRSDIEIVGVPRLTVDAKAPIRGASVVALLYDVDPEGRATLITRGAQFATARGVPAFDLLPQDWLLPARHRLALLIASSDDSTYTPGRTSQEVTVLGGRIVVPVLCMPRRPNLEGNPSLAVTQRLSIAVPPRALASRVTRSFSPCKRSR